MESFVSGVLSHTRGCMCIKIKKNHLAQYAAFQFSKDLKSYCSLIYGRGSEKRGLYCPELFQWCCWHDTIIQRTEYQSSQDVQECKQALEKASNSLLNRPQQNTSIIIAKIALNLVCLII